MTLERYAAWLARGRAHQAEGKPIDAMLCYRRALREASGGVDARFHLGEIAWYLGDPSDAIAAWQAAIERSPHHVPSLHALSDAFAAVGRFDASVDAAARVLALRSDEPRANALSLLARAALGQAIDDAALTDALLSRPVWPLALASALCVRMLAEGGRAQCPNALPAALDAAARAAATAQTADALRSVALALAKAGDVEEADAFAERYARSCQALHPRTMPLGWPLRTAGTVVRAGFIVTGDELSTAMTIVTAVTSGDPACECRVFVAGDIDATFEARADVRTLSADADAAARAIALLDLDVLIDLAGVNAASGPLLAWHPARETWALRQPGMPVAAALADRIFAGDADTCAAALAGALAVLSREIGGRPSSALGAADLAKSWDAAVVAHQRGDIGAAKEDYAKVLAAQPDSAAALYLTGVLMRAEGDIAAARERLYSAVRVRPDFVDARAALADLEVVTGNAAEGAAIARSGLETAPGSAALWRTLGQAALKLDDPRSAADAFERALAIDPSHGETHYNHGVALQTVRDAAEAARAYQRALAFRPELHAADFNLGVIFDQQGNAGAAIAAFSNVLDRAPAHVPAYKALAETLLAAGRVDAWFALFERFERHCPNHIALAALALEVCAYRADFVKRDDYLDGLRDGRFADGTPDEMLDALQQILYLLHFFDVEPDFVGRLARTHAALARQVYGAPQAFRDDRKPGRLRVGYLSGDFRNHVMGKMMFEALRHHDRDRFDVFGYSTASARDAWTERYESILTRLTTVDALTDRDAARRIGDDDLDLLIDLSTHTKGARPAILASKPARVQVTHVASAGTLAMEAVDFKLTDRYADIEHDPNVQIEPPLVMEGCVYPYRHVAPAATDIFTRERLRIPQRAVLIGAFCTPLKLSQRCLALWREVLQRIPDAILVFSPVQPSLRAVFTRICAAAGIDRHRIAFVPQGRDDAENQARYRLIDFVLDPLPYGGVNGTLEALDMHVPVVTLVGRRHGERTSFSILSNLGIDDTIAHTGIEYAGIAERLASDPVFMHALRDRIGAALSRSTLTDMPAHTRNLEQAYVAALGQRAPEALAG